ncbi:class I SAM-dependent methyltransferase [Amycolatopsis sp. NPDC051045]|uniref:class I SAM-dependent methyltransferase n=1 Tax=Amycolatopsis sp. NPDC051045 TaxID=3156922 RepID=UPI0034269B03
MPVFGTLDRPVREQAVRDGGTGAAARHDHSRLHAVDEALKDCPGGVLLDVGCGPGMVVRHLLDDRPGDFAVTGCDRSAAMVGAARRRAGKGASFSVGDIEELPFADGAFDVALAVNVLEHVDAGPALHEIARVVRPGGLAVVTTLNPRSPYRLVERALGRRSGSRALAPRRLRHELWRAGLQPVDTLFYDVTALVPPLDRLVHRWDRRWRAHPETTVARGVAGRLGTGYLIAARRL